MLITSGPVYLQTQYMSVLYWGVGNFSFFCSSPSPGTCSSHYYFMQMNSCLPEQQFTMFNCLRYRWRELPYPNRLLPAGYPWYQYIKSLFITFSLNQNHLNNSKKNSRNKYLIKQSQILTQGSISDDPLSKVRICHIALHDTSYCNDLLIIIS